MKIRREDLLDTVRADAHENNERVLAELGNNLAHLPEEIRVEVLRRVRAEVYAISDMELTRFKARIAEPVE